MIDSYNTGSLQLPSHAVPMGTVPQVPRYGLLMLHVMALKIQSTAVIKVDGEEQVVMIAVTTMRI